MDGVPSTYVEGFHDRKAVRRMRYRPLGRTGLLVSLLSLGGAPLGGLYGETNEHEMVGVVRTAIQKGINFIDTAPFYGHGKSETILGKALQGIPRQAYYIGTKTSRYGYTDFDFSAKKAWQSVDESLHRLGLDYVDLLQVHDVEYSASTDVVCNEALVALQKMKEQGKCRFIGITGYSLPVLKLVSSNSPVVVDTLLSYARLTMNDSSLLDYLPFFKEQGIGVINASPLSMDLLSNRPVPPDWHPAPQYIKDVCRQAANYCQSQHVDIAKLAMHYSVDNQDIATTVMGAASADFLEKNLAVTHEELTAKERAVLSHIMRQYFNPLKNSNWDGIEVQKYWEEMRKLEQE